MRDDSEIVVGEKVDLVKEKGRFYRTMIEDMYGGGSYLVGVPSIGGIPMLLHVDDEVFMVFYRESGRYIAPMRVAAFEKSGEIRYALLLQKSEPQRDQRRGAFRLPARMKVLVCEYEEGMEKRLAAAETSKASEETAEPDAGEDGDGAAPADAAETDDGGNTNVIETVTLEAVASKDISLTGISISTKREYRPGEVYLLKLHLRDPLEKKPFTVCARVTRAYPGHDRGTFHVGLRFIGLTRNMNEALSRYVYALQQKLLKQRSQYNSG